MRIDGFPRLNVLVLSGALLAGGQAHAEPSPADGAEAAPGEDGPIEAVGLTLSPGTTLAPGERGSVWVTVQGAQALRNVPMLLTITLDGTAAELLQGRFLRGHGESSQGGEMITFRVPILGRGGGAAVLWAELRSFRCGERCRAVQLEAQTRIQIVEP